jgi:hypothetical protein
MPGVMEFHCYCPGHLHLRPTREGPEQLPDDLRGMLNGVVSGYHFPGS